LHNAPTHFLFEDRCSQSFHTTSLGTIPAQ
jgi:hypothetical protein